VQGREGQKERERGGGKRDRFLLSRVLPNDQLAREKLTEKKIAGRAEVAAGLADRATVPWETSTLRDGH